MILLHRRVSALLALIGLLAFVAGAGFDAPSVIPAGIILLFAVFVQPGERRARALEPLWRAAALVLVARATLRVIGGDGDLVLPMVDLLLLLLCAESLQLRDGNGDARHFALTFALLIAAAAYRPGPLFGLLFVAYVVCATSVLVLGHLARQARAHHIDPPAPRPVFLVRLALLSSIVLAVSAAVFVFFPRVPRGWAARTQIVSAVVGFSDRVSIGEHGARIEPNPRVVLRIEFPNGAPVTTSSLHWRGRAYDRFDGWTWSRSQLPATPAIEARWDGPLVDQVIHAQALTDANVLFGLHAILDITQRSAIQPIRVTHSDYVYYGDADPIYRVRSRTTQPPVALLRTVAFDAAAAIRAAGSSIELEANLQLPPLSARVRALADSFRLASPTPYDFAASVEAWLRTQFAYTLDLPATRREATLDHFLFERRAGHCEYFSTAMAVLLRAGGLPTRNVNGFLGGEWNEFGQFLTVTQNNAHSWVEVQFPGFGWITFDPTPAGAAAAAARRGYLGRFRRVIDGMEHRWGKWILDYDIGRQANLLNRLQSAFSAEPAGARPSADRGRNSLLRLVPVVIVLLIGALLALRRFRWSAAPRSSATRLYLSLRRAYTRAGHAPPHALTPLAFAHVIHGSPGSADAKYAVELYLRARFGPQRDAANDLAQLRERVTAARRALRRRGSRDSPA